MKKIKPVITALLLVTAGMSSQAQLDFKYQNTLVQEYVPIEQADEELELREVAQNVPLGFEIKSYGLVCNSLDLFKGYLALFFDNWRYDCHFFATGNKGIALNYDQGRWLIKRLLEDGKKTIILEVRDAEYVGFPNEKFNYQFKINEQGEYSIHYGQNNLSSGHDLNSEGNRAIFVEADYEKNLADTNGHADSIRSVVIIYGDPLEPSVDVNTVEHELGSFTHHPPANMLYLVKSSALSGVAEVSKGRSVLRITPNPANGSCLVDLSGTAVTRLHMTDVSGRRVLEKPVPANEHKLNLDLSSLPAGTYFLQGMNKGKTEVVEKLLVK